MKPTILHVSKYYYPDLGGIESVAKYLAEGMEKYNNVVVCFSSDGKYHEDYVNGVHVYRVAVEMSFMSQDVALGYRKLMRKLVAEYKPEFVHVHPAVLPYIRGADGLLWSTLLNGKPGASCFYMVPELDEGHLITTAAFEPVQLAKPQSADLKTLYRLIFSFYDPVIRALCLQKVLKQFGTLSHLPTQEQETRLGITYHFMHPLLQEKVLDKIFV